MNEVMNLLLETAGNYFGEGRNHEGQRYRGSFELKPVLDGKVLELRSRAEGIHGETFHEETSLISSDLAGELNLYVTSNNHPGLTVHKFNRVEIGSSGEKRIVFRFGDVNDKNTFREEITIATYQDGSVEHHYAWGMPGGNFEPRSGSKMARVIN